MKKLRCLEELKTMDEWDVDNGLSHVVVSECDRTE